MALFAAAAVPMVGCVGIGVDYAQWVLWKRQLHSAADVAALAGATAKAEGTNVTVAVNRALSLNDHRAFVATAIENAPTGGSYSGDTNAVRVQLETSQSLPFSSMFLATTPIFRVSATALARIESPYCVIALDPVNTAVTISGSAAVDMNCGLASNSDFDATTSDAINASALSAVGTVNNSGAVSADTKINNGIAPVADPFAGTTIPDVSAACTGATYYNNRSNRVEMIGPGCYTGITIRGNLTLLPGTYYIDGGPVSVGAGATLKGAGVTLVFTNSDPSPTASIDKFNAKGSSIVTLSAPSSGDFAGMLMIQDSRAGAGDGHFITGTSGTETGGGLLRSSYEGSIYSPSADVTFTGNSGIDTPCMQIVANTVEFIGNTNITNNCPSGSGASSFKGTAILRIVE